MTARRLVSSPLLRLGLLALAVTAALLLFAGPPAEPVQAQPTEWDGIVPPGLYPGDKYRILFLTTASRNGESTYIDDYNTFVQSLADAAVGNPFDGITFKALVSTQAVDARCNTQTHTNVNQCDEAGEGSGEETVADVPIYYYKGHRVADDYADFYDGNWDSQSPKDRNGNTSSISNIVFVGGVYTGSRDNGVASEDYELGQTHASYGNPRLIGEELSSSRNAGTSTRKRFYALSQVLTVPGPPLTNREILEILYDATGGNSWDTNTNWKDDNQPLSNWFGVTTNSGGGVTGLILSENSLDGTIPAQLGKLAELTSLDLEGNGLTGEIPTQLGNLVNLEELSLSDNRLTGPIPAQLGSLASLEELSLSGNRLAGAIPAQLGSLASLEDLSLSDNRLTGPIPTQLGSLANLDVLNLAGNMLTGCVPDQLRYVPSPDFTSSGALRFCGPTVAAADSGELAVSWNPPATEEGRGITAYDVRHIRTSDDEAIDANWTVVENAWSRGVVAPGYTITGLTIGASYDVQVRSRNAAQRIDPWSATATGTPTGTDRAILEAFYDATGGANWTTNTNWKDDEQPLSAWHGVTTDSDGRVTGLQLYSNSLSGMIPTELGSLAKMRYLSLSGNMLNGRIPTELGSLAKLRHLSLSGNRLAGAIPAQLGSLVSLDVLNLSGNMLTGCVPDRLRYVPDIDFATGGLRFCGPAMVAAGSGELAVSWNLPNANYGYLTISAYDLRYILTAADEAIYANWTVVENARISGLGLPPGYTITGLTNGASYDVQVRSRNAAQRIDPWSATAMGTPETELPAAPSAPKVAAAGSGALAVSWNRPPGSGRGALAITAYDVRHIRTSADATIDADWTVADDAWTAVGAGARAYTITGLTSGASYDVQVRAANSDGAGPWSGTSTGRVYVSPGRDVSIGWVPKDLQSGEQYRVLFVTGRRDARSSDIEAYNDFVQDQANGADGQPFAGVVFRALGSTAAVDARCNTQTHTDAAHCPGAPLLADVPVYYYQGRKVADGYADLYDGAWDTHQPRNRNGRKQFFVVDVSTGSKSDGPASPGLSLGEPNLVRYGRADQAGKELYGSASNSLNRYHLYALSEVLTAEQAGVNLAPVFDEGDSAQRWIWESRDQRAGRNIGLPFNATDEDAETGESLTYEVGGADGASFSIDPQTGQLKNRAALDYEIQRKYSVTVSAVDDDGGQATIDVSINLRNLNEYGWITLSQQLPDDMGGRVTVEGDRRAAQGHPVTATLTDPDGGVDDVKWEWRRWEGHEKETLGGVVIYTPIESTLGKSNSYTPVPLDQYGGLYVIATYIDALGYDMSVRVVKVLSSDPYVLYDDLLPVEPAAPTVAAAGTGALAVSWTASSSTGLAAITAYDLRYILASQAELGELEDAPLDRGGRGLDHRRRRADPHHHRTERRGGLLRAGARGEPLRHQPLVGVGGAPETAQANQLETAQADPLPAVILSTNSPVVGVPLAAALLGNPDGGAGGLTWQWARSPEAGGPWTEIGGAHSRAYTPVEADAGHYLQAAASHTDAHGVSASSVAITANPVSAEPAVPENNPEAEGEANRAPAFDEGTQTTRSLAENAGAGVNLGGPVAAGDPDGDTLTYIVSGDDAGSFDIDDATGQLTTREGVSYDYEDKATYTVTVAASDGNGGTAAIEVTVNLTAVEKPGPVVNLELSATADSLTVTWQAPESGGAPDLPYIVRLSLPDGQNRFNRPEASQRSTTFHDLESGATYQVFVRAVNQAGWGKRADASITLPEDTSASAYIVNCKPAGADSSVAGCADALTEENLNGAKLRVQLEDDAYAGSLDAGDFTLVTDVPGLSVDSVVRKANRRAEVVLDYNGADFDDDRTIAVTVSTDALEGDTALTTGEVAIEGVVEDEGDAGGASGEGEEENPPPPEDPPASAYIVNCKPAGADSAVSGCADALTEENLNGAKLRIQLEDDTYAGSLDAASFTLVTNVPGLSVASVERKANRRAEVVLDYNGSDFDDDQTIAVTVSADALEGDTALTTGEVSVEAVVE